ncbi:hypothetical protein Cfor_05469 [Coptotermes formosanus]|uniref:Uncharacterized protein n=1 Tax=Coptotermes formosanus TaxID=36987 RepID=A0A6L2PBV3_COPFO|nr:hypothetical protein Cfor_05469 [Coptotermes formosanus]
MVVRYLLLVVLLQWDPNRPNSLVTFLGHTQLVYSAMWSPHVPSCFASVSGNVIVMVGMCAVCIQEKDL